MSSIITNPAPRDAQKPCTEQFRYEPNALHVQGKPIDWATAESMICAYRAHPCSFKTRVTTASTGTGTGASSLVNTLQITTGFKIPVSGLKAILGLPADEHEGEAKDLMLFFGVREKDLMKSSAEQYFTIILAPVDAENNVITDPERVYNYYNPCPSDCPSNLASIISCY